METMQAVTAFGSLSQETRLRVLRLLVKQGPAGMPAGTIGKTLDIPHSTLSFHLSEMAHAGLIVPRRKGRSMIYSANFELITDLVRFMVEDCCGVEFANIRNDKKRGCSVIELSNCCQPKEKKP